MGSLVRIILRNGGIVGNDQEWGAYQLIINFRLELPHEADNFIIWCRRLSLHVENELIRVRQTTVLYTIDDCLYMVQMNYFIRGGQLFLFVTNDCVDSE